MSQFLNCVLNRMAQANLFQLREPFGQRPRVDRHWVHILQQGGVWTQVGHVFCDVPQHRHRAQAAHNATYAQRVSNSLAQAVFLGDIEIGNRARLIATNLKRGDDKICTVQRLATI